jgi:hypothetical protein
MRTTTPPGLAGIPGTLDAPFSYDSANRRTSPAYPNGVMTSYGYDDIDRLTSLQVSMARLQCPVAHTHDASGTG